MNVKLAIFDLDGTLVDAYTAVQKSFNHALKILDYPLLDLETVRKSVGWGERLLIAKFVEEKDIDRALELYRAHHHEALASDVSVLPYAEELLQALKTEGCALAIASNRPAPFTRLILQNTGLLSFFDCLICGDQIERPKPEPDMLLKVLDVCGQTADKAVYVGDMILDVQAGRQARIQTVAVTTGSSSKEEILAEGPFACAADLNEVKEVLKLI